MDLVLAHMWAVSATATRRSLRVVCFLPRLLAFDDADEAGHEGAAGEGGFVHENEDVDGVAVVGEGAGEEAEVVGEDHAGGESGFEDEDLLDVVETVFVAAAFGGFDDDLEKLVADLGDAGGGLGAFFGEGLEFGGVD